MNSQLTLRAAYNRGQNPISPADVTFNILAPGVMTNHDTPGFTCALSKDSESTSASMVATIRMRQSSIGGGLEPQVLEHDER